MTASPGGVYRVPSEWEARFHTEYPDYRVRWSLAKSCWVIEQRCGRGAQAPISVDPTDDSLIRARDGYWEVMTFQPGDRMACPAVVSRSPRQVCGGVIKVPHRRSAETVCQTCRKAGRDGRTMAAFWPFDELLLDHLRFTDPLRVFWGADAQGHSRKMNGIQRAKHAADLSNQRLLAEAERKRRDASSIDAVDYRWVSGIPSTSGRSRQIDATTFR